MRLATYTRPGLTRGLCPGRLPPDLERTGRGTLPTAGGPRVLLPLAGPGDVVAEPLDGSARRLPVRLGR